MPGQYAGDVVVGDEAHLGQAASQLAAIGTLKFQRLLQLVLRDQAFFDQYFAKTDRHPQHSRLVEPSAHLSKCCQETVVRTSNPVVKWLIPARSYRSFARADVACSQCVSPESKGNVFPLGSAKADRATNSEGDAGTLDHISMRSSFPTGFSRPTS